MRRNKFLALLVVAVLFVGLLVSSSFAGLAAETSSWSQSDVIEFNSYNPSAQKTFLGQRLLGLFKNETSTITATGSQDLDLDDKTILFTSGAAGLGTHDATYANGEPGQTVAFVLVTDGGANVRITPVTATGFTYVELDSAKDTCIMTYQDDTVGWISAGGNSCTVN